MQGSQLDFNIGVPGAGGTIAMLPDAAMPTHHSHGHTAVNVQIRDNVPVVGGVMWDGWKAMGTVTPS